MPPLLILGGISGAGMTTALERYRPLFLVVTFLFLGLAFYLSYRPRGGARFSKLMTVNRVMLWAVTVVVIAFVFFPQYFTRLASADGGFTNDMRKTVLTVEGMTCPG